MASVGVRADASAVLGRASTEWLGVAPAGWCVTEEVGVEPMPRICLSLGLGGWERAADGGPAEGGVAGG